MICSKYFKSVLFLYIKFKTCSYNVALNSILYLLKTSYLTDYSVIIKN